MHHEDSDEVSHYQKPYYLKGFYLEVLLYLHVRKHIHKKRGYKTDHRFPYPYNLALSLQSKTTRAEIS